MNDRDNAAAQFKGVLWLASDSDTMNIHEYQGKALFKAHGVNVLNGVHCTTVDDALNAYDSLQSKVVAVKSQIHAGGRGKGSARKAKGCGGGKGTKDRRVPFGRGAEARREKASGGRTQR